MLTTSLPLTVNGTPHRLLQNRQQVLLTANSPTGHLSGNFAAGFKRTCDLTAEGSLQGAIRVISTQLFQRAGICVG